MSKKIINGKQFITTPAPTNATCLQVWYVLRWHKSITQQTKPAHWRNIRPKKIQAKKMVASACRSGIELNNEKIMVRTRATTMLIMPAVKPYPNSRKDANHDGLLSRSTIYKSGFFHEQAPMERSNDLALPRQRPRKPSDNETVNAGDGVGCSALLGRRLCRFGNWRYVGCFLISLSRP